MVRGTQHFDPQAAFPIRQILPRADGATGSIRSPSVIDDVRYGDHPCRARGEDHKSQHRDAAQMFTALGAGAAASRAPVANARRAALEAAGLLWAFSTFREQGLEAIALIAGAGRRSVNDQRRSIGHPATSRRRRGGVRLRAFGHVRRALRWRGADAITERPCIRRL